jgi:hypothetical protein
MGYPIGGTVSAGTLSADRHWFWDGVRWAPALSPDGLWRWDGVGWLPIGGVAGWPKWARPYASAAGRATFAVVSLAVVVAGYALWIVADLVAIAIYASAGGRANSGQRDLIAILVGFCGLIVLLAFVTSTVAVCMWMHRVYRNLPVVGATGLKYSPAWAAGAWFVPILSLFRPYRIVREIWQVSTPGVPWGVVNLWWALFLTANWSGVLVGRTSFGGGLDEWLDAGVNVIAIVAATLMLVIVRRITAGQERQGPVR